MQVDWLKKNLLKYSNLTMRLNMVHDLSTTKEISGKPGISLLGINRTSSY
jgi:putative transposase